MSRACVCDLRRTNCSHSRLWPFERKYNRTRVCCIFHYISNKFCNRNMSDNKSDVGMRGGDGADLDTVTLILKNPSQVAEDHFETSVRRDMSVRDLKDRLGKEYPGNPAPDSITLVYGGKVLHEEGMILSSILPSDSASVAMHMVVKRAQRHEVGTAAASASSRLPASASPRPHRGSTTAAAAAAADSGASTSTGDSDSTATEYSHDDPSEDRMPDESNTVVHREEEAAPSTSGDMSSRVFRAAYQAALQAIVSEGPASSPSGYAAGVQSHPGMAFLAPVITLPQPVCPTTADSARGSSTEDRGEAPQQVNQYIMPLIPVAYAMPGEGNVPAAQAVARRRRRRADAAERDHVAALLHALRGRDVAPRQNGGDAEPRGEQGQPRRRQVQIRIHINMRVLLQLAVLFFVVYQHCPPSRVVGLVSVALLFYLSSTAMGRRMLQRLYGYFNLHRAQEAPAPVPVEDRAEEDGVHALPQQHDEDNINNNPVGGGEPGAREGGEAPNARQPGFLQEIQAFLAGFLTSLLPAADNRHHENNPAVVQDVWRGQ